MKKLLLGLGLIILSACSSVSGVIRDKNTSSPVSAATITVPRTATTAMTDAFGHYHLNGMFIPGDTMMVNAPGYNIYTGSLKTMNDEFIDVDLVPKK